MRLEELVRYVHVDMDTGDIEYGCFCDLVGAVRTIFGRPRWHPFFAELYPLEEDEASKLCEVPEFYVPGLVVWEQTAEAKV